MNMLNGSKYIVMENHRNETYILCPRKKGRPRIHVDVCRECRLKKRCKAYQLYLQPELFK